MCRAFILPAVAPTIQSLAKIIVAIECLSADLPESKTQLATESSTGLSELNVHMRQAAAPRVSVFGLHPNLCFLVVACMARMLCCLMVTSEIRCGFRALFNLMAL